MITFRTHGERGLVQIDRPEPDCWVDVRNVDQADLAILERDYRIASELITDIMDPDEQARIEKEDEYTAIIMRLPVYDHTFEVAYFTVPVGIIIFPDKIVTICQRSSEVLDDLTGHRIKDFSLKNKSAFVLNLMGRSALTYLRFLKDLIKRMAIIERELQQSVKNNELIQLLSIQKSLVYFTTSITTNELLLEKLQKSPFLHFREEERELLEDVLTDNKQAIEMSNIYSSILTGTMDAFASVISNNLNMVMKRLTVASIILMLPNMVSGFFGMNVHLPFQESPFAFMGIVGVSVLSAALGTLVLSERKKRKLATRMLPFTQNLLVNR
ncbi:MAG TPA: magnesium transporter CorA family protein [Rectinemataceae bacterium]